MLHDERVECKRKAANYGEEDGKPEPLLLLTSIDDFFRLLVRINGLYLFTEANESNTDYNEHNSNHILEVELLSIDEVEQDGGEDDAGGEE